MPEPQTRAGRIPPAPWLLPTQISQGRAGVHPDAPMSELPPFTVRESPRAKRVILKVSSRHGLEVVIPQGFSRASLPALIEQKREWLERAFQIIQLREGVAVQPRELPDEINCLAIGRTFRLEYVPTASASLELSRLSPNRLRISGATNNLLACQALLKRWLQYQGRQHLIPWLADLSAETGLGYRGVQIRGQKSRWGSCSGQGTISLNYNLLLLRPALVRYLLLHELCHTVQLNHSAQFYQLLEKYEPGFKELRRELRLAGKQLPWWAR